MFFVLSWLRRCEWWLRTPSTQHRSPPTGIASPSSSPVVCQPARRANLNITTLRTLVFKMAPKSGFDMCTAIGSQHLRPRGTNQNTPRIQHEEAYPYFYDFMILFPGCVRCKRHLPRVHDGQASPRLTCIMTPYIF